MDQSDGFRLVRQLERPVQRGVAPAEYRQPSAREALGVDDPGIRERIEERVRAEAAAQRREAERRVREAADEVRDEAEERVRETADEVRSEAEQRVDEATDEVREEAEEYLAQLRDDRQRWRGNG